MIPSDARLGLATSGLPNESSRGKAGGVFPKEVSNEDPNISSECKEKFLLEEEVGKEEKEEVEAVEVVAGVADSKGEPKKSLELVLLLLLLLLLALLEGRPQSPLGLAVELQNPSIFFRLIFNIINSLTWVKPQ